MERNAGLKQNARNLRKNQTKEEGLLWNLFLKRYPMRFRRQYIIGNYIVDFYCHGARLVVELDGSQHYDPDGLKKDRERTEFLEQYDLVVLRVPNNEVMNHFLGVCEYIDHCVRKRIP